MKKLLISISFVLVFLLCSCNHNTSFYTYDFFAMDTFVTITQDKNQNSDKVKDFIEDFEKTLSRTQENSEIYNLNLNSTAKVSQMTEQILKKSIDIASQTDSAFEPCCATLVDLWDITAKNPVLPSEDDILKQKMPCSYTNLSLDGSIATLKNKAKVDLGGIAKGYCSQKCIEILKADGNKNALVNLGGNIVVCGSSPQNIKKGVSGWNIGIKNPACDGSIIGYVTLSDKIVSVSGAYERFFEKDDIIYHHIFDVKTGFPADSDLSSVAVISSDGLEADALSTALFVMGLEKGKDFYASSTYDFEVIFIGNDENIYISSPLAHIFTADDSAVALNGKKYKVNIIDKQ